MNLQDSHGRKVAWVTGASSGIGRAFCLRLADEGWSVAVSARGSEALETLAGERSGRIFSFPVDVTDLAAVKATRQAVSDQLGPIDMAVFSAGTYKRDSLTHFDSSALQKMVDLNIMGTAHCLEAIIPDMIARGRGQIGVVSSVAGYNGLPGGAFYGATKAALINMSEALYPGLKAKGIDLSLINPGFVDTPLTAKNDFPMPFMISPEEAADIMLAGLKTRRFEIIFPWKMALAIRFLHRLPQSLRFAITRRLLRKD